MINFVNTGADEAILKSMSTEGCSEDLIKAMNKQGLVQKDVTVQGKNGKTFTRKQWVKASDASAGDSSKKQTSIPDAVKECGVTGSESIQELEKIRHDLYKEITYCFKKYDKAIASNASDAKVWETMAGGKQRRLGALDKYIKSVKSIGSDNSKKDVVSSKKSQQSTDKKSGDSTKSGSGVWQKKLEDALYSAPGTAADYAVGQVLKELPKGTVIKTGQKALTASPPYELEVTYTKGDYDGWQYISKDYDTVYFNKVSKSICKVKDNSKFKLSVEVPESPAKSDSDTSSKDSKKSEPAKTAQKTQSSGRFKPSDFQFRAGGQQVADFVNSLDAEFGVEKFTNGNVGFGTLSLKDGDSVAFGYDDKGAYATWNGQQFRSAADLAKKWGRTSKDSGKKTLDSAHFDSIKSDKAEALKYLKDCGVQWTESSHAGINWMRAMAAYKSATGGQKSAQKTPTQSTSQATTPTAQVAQNTQVKGAKLSKEDAKKKTQSFTSKVGKTEAERKAFMDKVKSQGITWKDKADDGSDVAPAVSWMRCCMAMNKHFAEGGSFDASDKPVVTSRPKIFTEDSSLKVSGGGYKAGGGRGQMMISRSSAKQYIMLQATKKDGTWGKPQKCYIEHGDKTPEDTLKRMSQLNPTRQWRFDPDSVEDNQGGGNRKA